MTLAAFLMIYTGNGAVLASIEVGGLWLAVVRGNAADDVRAMIEADQGLLVWVWLTWFVAWPMIGFVKCLNVLSDGGPDA